MNIPNIPSDNLYKFIALASLITLILLVYVSKKTQSELSDEEIKYIGELKITIIKSNKLGNQLKSLVDLRSKQHNQLEQLLSELKTGKYQNVKSKNSEIEKLENKISSMSEKIDLDQKELDILEVQNETTSGLLKNKRILIGIIDNVILYSSGLLLLLMSLGFYLWYVRVQKYQDKILKVQAKEIEKEKTD